MRDREILLMMDKVALGGSLEHKREGRGKGFCGRFASDTKGEEKITAPLTHLSTCTKILCLIKQSLGEREN